MCACICTPIPVIARHGRGPQKKRRAALAEHTEQGPAGQRLQGLAIHCALPPTRRSLVRPGSGAGNRPHSPLRSICDFGLRASGCCRNKVSRSHGRARRHRGQAPAGGAQRPPPDDCAPCPPVPRGHRRTVIQCDLGRRRSARRLVVTGACGGACGGGSALSSSTARPLRYAASTRSPAPQVLARLSDRRIAVEKELSALGESKKGATDIFRHCRGFERAYSIMLQVPRQWELGVLFSVHAAAGSRSQCDGGAAG